MPATAGEDGDIDDRSIARWRLASLHLTGPAFDSPEAVVEGLLGVQAENHSQASWAVACRTAGTTAEQFQRACDEGEIIRTHVLRPTWHYVRPADLHWIAELTAPRIRRSLAAVQRPTGLSQPTVEHAVAAVAEDVAATGPLTRPEIAERLSARGIDLTGQQVGIVLMHAEIDVLVCSGPMRDGEQTYALADERVPAPRRLDRDEALAELALRYVASHGPVTDRDLAYWASQTLTDTRAGLAAVADQLETFEHDGRTWWHAGNEPDPAPDAPPAHVLQMLDEYHNGVQDTRHVLDVEGLDPPGRPANTGMVLVDGQKVGGMRRSLDDEEVTFEVDLYRSLTPDEHAHVATAADRYGRFLGRRARLVTTVRDA